MGASQLHPEVARRLALFQADANRKGWPFTITSTFRSLDKQRQLYEAYLARGRTGLPAAPPGYSTHNYGFAFDAVAKNPSHQPLLGRLAECYGLHWAGSADRVHFDVFGRAWRSLLEGRAASDPYRC